MSTAAGSGDRAAAVGPGGGVPADVAAAAAEQDLGPELAHLAWEIACLAGAEAARRPLLLTALAVLAAERAGSTRLRADAATLDDSLRALAATAEDVAGVTALLAAAQAGDPATRRLLGGPGDYRPLLLAGGHLYTQRSWQLEQSVGKRLRELLAAPAAAPAGAVEAALADVLARPPRDAAGRPSTLSTEQLDAVRTALGGRVAAITGGPGTGKTWILATVLRVVARLGDPPLSQVVLAAPTGKAADRIRASLLAALRAVAEPGEADVALLAALPPALTLHRLLSYSPAGERFRHHEGNPLGERLVLVDESSMMDLALADHLLRSLPAGGSLVLLGDARQLPSVEAGAVLRDLVDAPAASPRVARLARSWRMDAGDPAGRAILAFAARVASGDLGALAGAVAVCADAGELTFGGCELLPTPPVPLARFLAQWWDARLAPGEGWPSDLTTEWQAEGGELEAGQSERLGRLFASLEASRLVTATRGWSGGTGAAALNGWCRARLRAALQLRPARRGGADDPLVGEPLLVTRNDYRRGLYNGDQGVVLRVAFDGAPAVPAAVFRSPDGFRAHPLAALRGRTEPGWATTVHKAQGSEHDVVGIVLPPEPHRLLTRELLYTAITRARRGVVIAGTEEVLRLAAARTSERSSGLAALLGDVASRPPAPLPKRQLALPF